MNKRKVTEQELLKRVYDTLKNEIDYEDFILEVNRILGTDYIAKDVEWGD